MSSDEDNDYMSEKFLSDCVSEDVRPGLLFNRSQKRSHEMLKKQAVSNEENKKRFRPVKEVEAERREEGLNTPIDSSNKGFALLQKMGYKPGSTIGKKGDGRINPVALEIKTGRSGLGKEAALKEVAERKLHLLKLAKQRRGQLMDVNDYRARLARQQAEKLTEVDLRKSQRICRQLDIEKNIETPSEIWFWPEVEDDDDDDDDDEKDKNKDNNKDNNDSDNESDNSNDSKDQAHNVVDDDDDDDDDDKDKLSELQPQEKLEILTLYLHKMHCYCMWCGIKYEDSDDFSENCPGPTRDDH